MTWTLRPYQSADLDAIKAITVEGFAGVSLDHILEETLGGELGGHDWRWRKARHIDDDVAAHADGIFVAEAGGEAGGEVIGYISTVIDREAGKGRIPNLAVSPTARGRGLGRALIEHALEYFRNEKLGYAVIETMETNPIGQTLYPATGFQEIARQVHYAQRL
jgi:ribosomal protein S18 acetylase RimI-like enzyme|tara:strand:+ start:115 stop:603 length:489 start_codon:yes stop_codon:yes gene_type:complete